LDGAAKFFLKDEKETIDVTNTSELQAGDEFSRQKMAIYCLKDAYLPMQLSRHEDIGL
jgi:DNA polymerase delta subunit 1